ncbi:MAG: hypothetical protein K2X66_02175 [Cyanobacteria bacterium]|nr:hypothetical protein [Cyanobacteriota bacterium]
MQGSKMQSAKKSSKVCLSLGVWTVLVLASSCFFSCEMPNQKADGASDGSGKPLIVEAPPEIPTCPDRLSPAENSLETTESLMNLPPDAENSSENPAGLPENQPENQVSGIENSGDGPPRNPEENQGDSQTQVSSSSGASSPSSPSYRSRKTSSSSNYSSRQADDSGDTSEDESGDETLDNNGVDYQRPERGLPERRKSGKRTFNSTDSRNALPPLSNQLSSRSANASPEREGNSIKRIKTSPSPSSVSISQDKESGLSQEPSGRGASREATGRSPDQSRFARSSTPITFFDKGINRLTSPKFTQFSDPSSPKKEKTSQSKDEDPLQQSKSPVQHRMKTTQDTIQAFKSANFRLGAKDASMNPPNNNSSSPNDNGIEKTIQAGMKLLNSANANKGTGDASKEWPQSPQSKKAKDNQLSNENEKKLMPISMDPIDFDTSSPSSGNH